MLTTSERPLTEAERHSLTDRLEQARRESRTALARVAMSSAAVCGILAILTMLASGAPRPVIILVWSAVAVVFTLWIGLPWHRTMRQQVVFFDDALRASRARVTRVQSSRVVEFEEEEDEGACWAFEHGPGTSLVIVGQEFYEDDDFPNSDFTIVEFLGTRGQPVTSVLEKVGAKLRPERVVPASVKRRLEIPETLTVANAPLERLEEGLRRAQ